jgi:hypothetical protein
MTLPTIKRPTFKEKLPDGTPFVYQPFTAEEQKNVLLAKEASDDGATMLKNVADLVHICTFGKIDFLSRPPIDLEKALVYIRGKSVSENIELNWRCPNQVESRRPEEEGKLRTCGHENHTDVVITDCTVFNEQKPLIVDVSDTIKIKLLPMLLSHVIDDISTLNWAEYIYRENRVEWVAEGNTVFNEFSEAEWISFCNQFPPRATEEIVAYYTNQETAIFRVELRCHACGYTHPHIVRGTFNFLV